MHQEIRQTPLFFELEAQVQNLVSFCCLGSPSGLCVSAPRVLVLSQPGSSLEIVEECISAPQDAGAHLSIPITEILVGEHATLKHKYVQMEDQESYHIKGTLVDQASNSKYELVEASVGAKLSRHDVGIVQVAIHRETFLHNLP